MTKPKPQGALPDPILEEEPARQPRSGIQNLRNGLTEALHLTRGNGASEPDLSQLNRSELIERVTQLIGTTDKQARVIETLEVMLEQVRRAHRQERSVIEREQKKVFRDQDRFLSQLIADHEAAQQAVHEERDAALARIEELQVELDAAHTYCRELETQGRPAAGREAAAVAESADLRRELAFAQQRIDKLGGKFNLARSSLHRVMSQRDEAHEHVRRLVRELNDVGAPVGPAPTAPQAEQSTPFESSTDSSVRATLRPRPSSPPAASGGPSSPLALALANSDPARRKRSAHPGSDPDSDPER